MKETFIILFMLITILKINATEVLKIRVDVNQNINLLQEILRDLKALFLSLLILVSSFWDFPDLLMSQSFPFLSVFPLLYCALELSLFILIIIKDLSILTFKEWYYWFLAIRCFKLLIKELFSAIWRQIYEEPQLFNIYNKAFINPLDKSIESLHKLDNIKMLFSICTLSRAHSQTASCPNALSPPTRCTFALMSPNWSPSWCCSNTERGYPHAPCCDFCPQKSCSSRTYPRSRISWRICLLTWAFSAQRENLLWRLQVFWRSHRQRSRWKERQFCWLLGSFVILRAGRSVQACCIGLCAVICSSQGNSVKKTTSVIFIRSV